MSKEQFSPKKRAKEEKKAEAMMTEEQKKMSKERDETYEAGRVVGYDKRSEETAWLVEEKAKARREEEHKIKLFELRVKKELIEGLKGHSIYNALSIKKENNLSREIINDPEVQEALWAELFRRGGYDLDEFLEIQFGDESKYNIKSFLHDPETIRRIKERGEEYERGFKSIVRKKLSGWVEWSGGTSKPLYDERDLDDIIG